MGAKRGRQTTTGMCDDTGGMNKKVKRILCAVKKKVSKWRHDNNGNKKKIIKTNKTMI